MKKLFLWFFCTYSLIPSNCFLYFFTMTYTNISLQKS